MPVGKDGLCPAVAVKRRHGGQVFPVKLVEMVVRHPVGTLDPSPCPRGPMWNGELAFPAFLQHVDQVVFSAQAGACRCAGLGHWQ